VTLRNTLRLAGGALLAVLVVLLGPSLSGPMTAAAQDAAPDEAAAYRAFHEASQGTDTAAALAAAKAYLDKFPSGQYADAIKKWQDQARLTQLDAAIKDKRTADMITIGKEILAADPENLNVIYALAFNIRRNELLASPPVYTNADAAVELANKGIGLIDAGKTLNGVASFDKEATLGWMKQILAMNAAKAGNAAEAIKLYEQSTAHAPGDTQIAGRNLFAVVTLRQSKYGEAAKAFNALPDADKTARRTRSSTRLQALWLSAAARECRPPRWIASTSCSRRFTRAASPRTPVSTASRRSWRRRRPRRRPRGVLKKEKAREPLARRPGLRCFEERLSEML
jgi:tetratricopeptide (TPR) repeat protein